MKNNFKVWVFHLLQLVDKLGILKDRVEKKVLHPREDMGKFNMSKK